MGIIKGKTAIKVFKSFPVLKRKAYWSNHFWSRGYCSSTIGLDEGKIKKYVKYQDEYKGRKISSNWEQTSKFAGAPMGAIQSHLLRRRIIYFFTSLVGRAAPEAHKPLFGFRVFFPIVIYAFYKWEGGDLYPIYGHLLCLKITL